MAAASSPSPAPPQRPEDLEWEEWDSSTSPLSFFHHCLAGSFAGVAEHTLLYPLDTVKTCWQSQVLHNAGSASGGSGCSMVNNCGVNSVLSNNPLVKVREMMANNIANNNEVRLIEKMRTVILHCRMI